MARGRKRRSSQEDLDAAIESVLAQMSYEADEKTNGVPGSTIRDNLMRQGLARSGVHQRGCRRVAEPDVVALKAIETGSSQVEAAAKAIIGVSTLGGACATGVS